MSGIFSQPLLVFFTNNHIGILVADTLRLPKGLLVSLRSNTNNGDTICKR
jgi:hypothetical protein